MKNQYELSKENKAKADESAKRATEQLKEQGIELQVDVVPLNYALIFKTKDGKIVEPNEIQKYYSSALKK